ncbi:MAG: CAP domain-containing protein [Sandarakinorhabdus sp.]|nr:CAP domain-containing protein [Sandarakinorhabdus sp.]
MRSVLLVLAAGLSLSGQAVAAQSLADDVLTEINYARAHPQAYADELRDYRRLFNGRLVGDDPQTGGHLTREGVAAVDEAIRALERQPALPPLEFGEVLAEAAQGHADEQGPRGLVGHQSPSGASPSARVQARGGGPYVAETISYGSATPQAVVRQLIVDDGVPDRGHRKIVFSPDMRFAGAGCGPHAAYGHSCVIDYGQTPDGMPRAAGSGTRRAGAR